jgi:hypothetical protein
MESLLRDKLMKHLEEKKLLNASQHSFTLGRLCTSNFLEFMEKVMEVVDDGQPWMLCFWILQKHLTRYQGRDFRKR